MVLGHHSKQGILILSGGLTFHSFREMFAFSEDGAQDVHKSFHTALIDAVKQPEVVHCALLSILFVDIILHRLKSARKPCLVCPSSVARPLLGTGWRNRSFT